MIWTTLGALTLAVAVLVGAFGAHALRERLDAYARDIYERAVFYHFVHGLGLVALGCALGARLLSPGPAFVAGCGLVAGIVVFSGSLYALALSGARRWGAVTPLGGIAFVLGWLAFAFAGIVRP